MSEDESQYDDFEEADEGDEDDEGDDAPAAVFVGIPAGAPGSDDAFRVIAGVCDRLELDALRARPGQSVGSRGGDEAIQELLDAADFAILDVSQKRATLAQEIALLDREFDPAFIVLIAKAPPPRLPDLEGREISVYADKGDLRAVVERHLNAMIDAWHEGEVEEGDEEDE
jgi:hypothetical protein